MSGNAGHQYATTCCQLCNSDRLGSPLGKGSLLDFVPSANFGIFYGTDFFGEILSNVASQIDQVYGVSEVFFATRHHCQTKPLTCPRSLMSCAVLFLTMHYAAEITDGCPVPSESQKNLEKLRREATQSLEKPICHFISKCRILAILHNFAPHLIDLAQFCAARHYANGSLLPLRYTKTCVFVL